LGEEARERENARAFREHLAALGRNAKEEAKRKTGVKDQVQKGKMKQERFANGDVRSADRRDWWGQGKKKRTAQYERERRLAATQGSGDGKYLTRACIKVWKNRRV